MRSTDFLRRRWRTVWGLGISLVLIGAVGPYPIRAAFETGEVVHRLHDTVGSVQYLTLWAVPVLIWTLARGRLDAWRVALATSSVVLAGAIWAGGVWSSGSWLQLATLLLLWPTGTDHRDWWRRLPRPGILSAASMALLSSVVVRNVPRLMHQQHIGATDSHGLRFHYGGMGTAYLALLVAVVVAECWPVRRDVLGAIVASCLFAGLANLAWPDYESALPRVDAWSLIAAGLLTGRIALPAWHESRISWPVAGRSRSSSSHPRPTTPS